jgi:hypothetical protein
MDHEHARQASANGRRQFLVGNDVQAVGMK